MVLLLLATLGSAAAHYKVHSYEGRVIGMRFVVAAIAMLAMPALLASRVIWPDWHWRGMAFLALALVTLGATAWFHRARLNFPRNALERATRRAVD